MTIDPPPPQVDPRPAPAWLPPRLSEKERDRGLRLGRAWKPLRFEINRLSALLKPVAMVWHSEPVERLIAIKGRLNAVAVEFLVAREDIMSLARHIEPNFTRLEIKDHALAPLLDWLTHLFKPDRPDHADPDSALTILFESSEAANSNEASLFLELSVDALRFHIGIRNVTDALIDESLAAWPLAKHAYHYAKVAVQISCGYADLAPAELNSLRTGDVIVVDDGPGDIGSRFLFVGGAAYLWNHSLNQLKKIPFNNAARRRMTDEFDEFDYEEDFDSADAPEAATTKVAFLAGVAHVPISDLQSADVGYIFETHREAGAVDILVAGKKIGLGQLVEIENGVGVRITRLIES